MRSVMGLFVLAAISAGCGPDPDENMWECQLSVQKGNAGKDAAAAERARDIEACMDQRGFRLNTAKAACREGSVDSGCYAAR